MKKYRHKKIKVLQVAAISSTIRAFLFGLIKRLQEEGYEVHGVCTEIQEDLKRSVDEVCTLHFMNIDRKISPFSNLKTIYNLYRYIKKEQFDIVHVHTPLAALLGRIAARLAGVPIIIYTVHGFYFHEHMNPLIRRIFIAIERYAGKITTFFFTVSNEDHITAVAEKICSADSVVTIYNGVDVRRFDPAGIDQRAVEKLRNELGIAGDKRVVGFVGRLVKEKGLIEIIEAAKILSEKGYEVLFLIVGDVTKTEREKGSKEHMVSLVKQYGLDRTFIFSGNRSDIPELLSLMDVFVLPSYREGLPVTVIEAMAMGQPVVATDIRGIREEVVDKETGFLIPLRDATSLAMKIGAVLDNNSLRKSMGERGRQRAVALFDEQKTVEKQMTIYESLINTYLPT